MELFPVGNGDLLAWGETEGKKGFTRGRSRNKLHFGKIPGRIENDPLIPTLSKKTVMMRMMARDILRAGDL